MTDTFYYNIVKIGVNVNTYLNCMKLQDFRFKDGVLGLIVFVLVSGLLTLAIIDVSCRPAFLDLAKVAIGAYIGLLIPQTR